MIILKHLYTVERRYGSMVENDAVRKLLMSNIEQKRIAGASVLIRKNGRIVCDSYYGYANIEKEKSLSCDSIFRLASMTKPIMAIAIMKLQEEGKLDIHDKISHYLPEFSKKKIAGREITILDILNHSSGLGQTPYSTDLYENKVRPENTLPDRVRLISELPLDFQPGEQTGYSPSVAYEVLGRIIEISSNRNLQDFIQTNVCEPLGCKDLSFRLTQEQNHRLVQLYEYRNGGLKNVSDTEPFWKLISSSSSDYCSGSAGLLGTIHSYDRIVQMLAKDGITPEGTQYLTKESVRLLSSESAEKHMEMNPGVVLGLGMAIFQTPEKAGRKLGKGTFGWSGAYGTHFFIDKERKLTVILGVNLSNIGGADSFLSRELENVIAEEYAYFGKEEKL